MSHDSSSISKPASFGSTAKSGTPFTQVSTPSLELAYIAEAIASGHTAGDGTFTRRCKAWLEQHIGCRSALLTHSCTAALEMAALLCNLQPGDEVIMPSYTFVSTANAFVLRGAVPVFVDIRPDTLNLDEAQVESAITEKTKAIVPVHYAGVSCEMKTIMEIADRYQLVVIEDAAQALYSRYQGQSIGQRGHLAVLSFHQTKNIVSGEGGALLINDARFVERAEIIREKGTNRSQFFRGEVDKYTWVDVGSSYLPSDLLAAFLWAQLERIEQIQQQRFEVWNGYHGAFAELEHQGKVQRPTVPIDCQHNAHLYYLLTADLETRTALLAFLKAQGIQATFHYVPLHCSPAGRKYGRTIHSLDITNRVSDRIVRLPLSATLSLADANWISSVVLEFYKTR